MTHLNSYQKEKLKEYWSNLQDLYQEFLKDVEYLEYDMREELEIDDLEFFHTDSGYVGIGNISRTMDLIDASELEGEE